MLGTAASKLVSVQVLDKADGSKLNFSTREQVVQQLRWETLDTARFYDSGK